MLLFIVADSCPSGESIREGPAVDCEADTVQDEYTGILRAPESGGHESGCLRGEEGGVMVIGGAGWAMSRDGERVHPGENEGWEEGLYRSNESTGEKTCG